MEMTVRTLPVWVIMSVVFIIILVVIASVNYYLPRFGKLRVECAMNKSLRRRNNTIIRMRRRIDEDSYPWIAFLMYTMVSICFVVENRRGLFDGEYIILKALGGFFAWLFSALIIVCFIVAFMKIIQENAVKDLKYYYSSRYGITIIYLQESIEKEYQEYELSN